MTRGRRGSDGYGFSHDAGERFILLRQLHLADVIEDNGQIGLLREYKAISNGETAVPERIQDFTDQGVRLMPYAVGHVAGARDMSSNLTISWIRRTRTGGDDDWRDAITTVPLGEASEAYQTDILDNMGNVLRTIDSTSQSAYYSAADQTTDFGSPQSSVSCAIYQMSAVVGRGFAAEASV
jgi:hypothetical protein